ncbi:hypothetical protein QBC44DRAFT_116194 [Cladorrhinum sp. PSN332]|nr:hypothetical protein QBC44DRAFT_116194 [Cladorrhinum sp. PSN332]
MLFFTLLVLSLSAVATADNNEDHDCPFHLTGVTNINVSVGQLPGGQVQGGNLNNTATLFHLFAGGLYDDYGRGCWWADPTTVLVCDIYPPDGPDALYHVAEDGCLHYNGSSTFYACKAGRYGRVNYYLEQRDATCRQAFLQADNSCETPMFPPIISTTTTTSSFAGPSTTSTSFTSSLTSVTSSSSPSSSSSSLSWSTRPTPCSPSPRLPPGVTTGRPSGSVSGTGGQPATISPIWQNTTWAPPRVNTSINTSTSSSTTQVEMIPVVTYTAWRTTHVHTPGGPVTVTTVTVTQRVEAAEATFAFAVEVVEVYDEDHVGAREGGGKGGKGGGGEGWYGAYYYGKKEVEGL